MKSKLNLATSLVIRQVILPNLPNFSPNYTIASYIHSYIIIYLCISRECLDAIILRVNNMPEYFKIFCCVLNMRSCYESIVKSLARCYSVYKNELHIKKYIAVDSILSHFTNSLEKDKYLELSAKIKGSTTDPYLNKKERFFKVLLEENPEFIKKFTDYLALKDCPNHSELQYHLQKSESEILSSEVINYLHGIKKYQDYLKKEYLEKVELEVQDNFNNEIHQFVNLSLIKPQGNASNNDYLEELKDPYNLLFGHKKDSSNTTIRLNSIAEVFDTSGPVSQVILIQGSPGCGKTTLAKKICAEWAKGSLVQHYMLVVLLNLRDVTISEIESIDQMVKYTMGKDFVKEVVRDITCIEGKNVLLLLEGWDELPENIKQLNKSFFSNIIAKEILDNVSVLITSRPSSIGSIQKKFITRNIAILGFSEDQIEQYIDQCFLDSKHGPKDTLKHKFLAQLNSNPMLKSLAYVPVNLSILVYVFTQYESELPDTLTELYQQYVLLKLSLYNQRQSDEYVRFATLDRLPDYISENLNKLCELAHGGIMNQKLYFTHNDIEKIYQFVPLDYDGMGLLQVDNYMLRRGSNKTYNFIHKTVQEFLAAVCIHMIKVPEQKNILQCFQNEKYEIVLIFYAGLSGLKIFNVAEFFPYINEQDHRIYDYLWMKGAYFISKSFLRNCGTWLLLDNKVEKSRDLTLKCNEHRMSVLITCCAEAKNPIVCRAFSSSGLFHCKFCHVKFSTSAVSPLLLSSLSYCIAYSGKKWCVDCDCVFTEQDVVSLQKYLTGANDITGKLVALTSKIKRNAMHLFVESFLQPHSTLVSLNLSGSKFDDDCITILSEGLRLNGCLVIFRLFGCHISSKGILTIAKMLCYNNTLQYINLEKNKFAVEALIKFLQMIKNNTTLRMMKIDNALFLNEQIKTQLVLFNNNRKNPLMLNELQTFFFGDTLSRILK